MSEFKPITTQEEFDKRIVERLEQKERAVKKSYEGYLSKEEVEKLKSDHQTQIDALNTSNDEYKRKIAKYETDSVKTRIAIETGLPLELTERLKGTTEDEIREDAKNLCKFTNKKKTAPLGTEERENKGNNDVFYKKLLKELKAEKE